MTLNGCNSKDYTSIRGWLRDVFFLDFYLDKKYSVRFKIANWLLRSTLIFCLGDISYSTESCRMYAERKNEDGEWVPNKAVIMFLDRIDRSVNRIREN